jgi:hypothetical protein
MKWEYFPEINKDELFSSWLIRSANYFGCDPIDLTNSIWPGYRAWTVDIDRDLTKEKLDSLAKITNKGQQYFKSSLLKSHIQKIKKDLISNSSWPWVIPHGIRNRKHRIGLQFCPLCFSSKSTKYFKLNSRFAWHTCCEEHKIQLVEKCFNCKSVIQPHRVEAMNGDISTCFNCLADISNTQIIGVNSQALKFQNECDKVLLKGRSELLNTNTSEWFLMARLFSLLIIKYHSISKSKMWELLSSLGLSQLGSEKLATGLTIEMLSIEDRVLLFSELWKILSRGVDEITNQIRSFDIPISSFVDYVDPFPNFLLRYYNLKKLPKKRKTSSTISVKTKKSHQPRSKRSVLRMYARLKRKLDDMNAK